MQALESQETARQQATERMWQIQIQPAESVVDATYIPAKDWGILRRITDFFRGR